MGLLRNHKEAAAAIAGVFIFLPNWIFSYFVGFPNLEGVTTLELQVNVMIGFYSENALPLIAIGLITAFGTLAYYVVLTHQNIGSVGNALTKALTILPIFYVVNIITSFATIMGLFAFIIGALYLLGRFTAVSGVVAAETERGIIGSIKYGWKLTENVGWMACLMFFTVFLIGSIISFVIKLVFRLIFGLIGGSIATLLTDGVSALLSAALSIVLATVMIAIYRHLKPQVDGAAVNSGLP